MADDLLYEPAMHKIESSGLTAAKLGKGFRTLAAMAKESNADYAATTFRYLADGEQVGATYVPEITLGVRQPNATVEAAKDFTEN